MYQWCIDDQSSRRVSSSLLLHPSQHCSQTLTELRISRNSVGHEGARHLADALKVNQVRGDMLRSNDYDQQHPFVFFADSHNIGHRIQLYWERRSEISCRCLEDQSSERTALFTRKLIVARSYFPFTESNNTGYSVQQHWCRRRDASCQCTEHQSSSFRSRYVCHKCVFVSVWRHSEHCICARLVPGVQWRISCVDAI